MPEALSGFRYPQKISGERFQSYDLKTYSKRACNFESNKVVLSSLSDELETNEIVNLTNVDLIDGGKRGKEALGIVA